MIIECPACNTQYDIKVELPPEGRTVRCAKCENVWRAAPVMEESYPAEEAYEFAGEGAADAGYDASADETGGWGPEVEAEEEHEEETRAQAFSHGYYQNAGHRDEEASSTGYSGFAGSAQPSTGAYAAEEETARQEDTGGGSRWFSGFMRKSQTPAPAAQEEYSDRGQAFSAAGPAPFPRPNPAAAVGLGERSLDDARAAVRNVFASLGDQQRASQHTSSLQAPVTAYADSGQDAFPFRRPAETPGPGGTGWGAGAAEEQGYSHGSGTENLAGGGGWSGARAGEEQGYSHGSGTENLAGGGGWSGARAEEEQGYSHGSGTESFAGGGGWSGAGTGEETQAEAETEDASEGWLQGWQKQKAEAAASGTGLDEQLRAALQAHFPSHTATGEQAYTPAPEYQEEEPAAAGDGEEVLPESLTAFWQRPLPPRTGPSEGEAIPEVDVESELPPAGIVFDERLFRELGESRDLAQMKEQKARQPGGALVLAAAWGLFLCVAGGLTAGVLTFREIAAEAVPGLAPFYRALGMPVTAQPLIFEGMHYEWSVSEFKPVLHIKGAIYNRAHRAVKVPDILVSVKDNDPALDKEFPASMPVEGGKIDPEERAEFDIELASPSPSIAVVELELQNVR